VKFGVEALLAVRLVEVGLVAEALSTERTSVEVEKVKEDEPPKAPPLSNCT